MDQILKGLIVKFARSNSRRVFFNEYLKATEFEPFKVKQL